MSEHEDTRERERPGRLSESDPEPDNSGRPPVLLVIGIVLLVAAFVVLHLTGVLGPGSH
jgi:hypothetical protein